MMAMWIARCPQCEIDDLPCYGEAEAEEAAAFHNEKYHDGDPVAVSERYD